MLGQHCIYISARAHPDILAEAKYHTNANRYQSITFEDARGNAIQVTPISGGVQAHFVDGENQLAKLPSHAKRYDITIDSNTTITASDIDAMLQWEYAREIDIMDAHQNMAMELIRRIDQAAFEFERLEKLTLTIHRDGRGLQARWFYAKFARLEELSFKIGADVTSTEFREFIDSQVLGDQLGKYVVDNAVIFYEVA